MKAPLYSLLAAALMFTACESHPANGTNADKYAPVDTTPRISQKPDTFATGDQSATNGTDNAPPQPSTHGSNNIKPGTLAKQATDSITQKDLDNKDLTNRKYPRAGTN